MSSLTIDVHLVSQHFLQRWGNTIPYRMGSESDGIRWGQAEFQMREIKSDGGRLSILGKFRGLAVNIHKPTESRKHDQLLLNSIHIVRKFIRRTEYSGM